MSTEEVKALVEELRFGAEYGCDYDLIERAAAAIEALQAKVDRLTKENRELAADRPEMEEVNGHWEWKNPNYEQHMPKRGEWIVKGANRIDCSVCGHSVCFAFGLSDGSFDLYKYCPECGTKMEGMDANRPD